MRTQIGREEQHIISTFMTTHEFKWGKTSARSIDQNKVSADYHAKVPASTVVNQPMRLLAEPLSVQQVRALRAIHESTSPLKEAVKQQMLPETIMSTVANCQLVVDFMKLKSDFTARTSKLKAGAEKEKLAAEYRQAVGELGQAFAELGVPGLDEVRMEAAAKELQADEKAFNAVTTILSTAKPAPPPSTNAVKGGPWGVFNVATTALSLPAINWQWIYASIKFCQTPHTGSFTRHIGDTFALTFTVKVGKWSKSYTIASLSYDVDLQVHYSMTCCGGSVWGSASAQVCGSIFSFTRCASCNAGITGVGGISVSPTSNGCNYGLAATLNLQCEYNGVTLVHANYPLNIAVSGPCPLPGWPC